MITLQIKNKMFSVRGHSTVKDENDVDRYVVKGKFFSLGKKKRIYDMDGNLLYTVKNKLIRWFMNSCYIYDAEGNKIARIKQKFKLFKKEFKLTGYAEEIEIRGDFIQKVLEIYKNGEKIGEAGKKFFSLVDSFKLECYKDEDAPLLVALIVAIDNINDKNVADS